MPEQLVGTVTHFFKGPSVAIVRLSEGEVAVGRWAALPRSHERLHGKGGLDGSGPRQGGARDGRSGSRDPGGAARAAGGSGP